MQSIITFVLSSLYVIFIDYIANSAHALQKALVLPIIILAFILYRMPKIVKNEALSFEKYIFFFWVNTVIQILIISTGGLQSPFLIFLLLSMIGISLVFSFSFSFSFLIFSLIVIIVDGLLHHTLLTFVLENPGTVLLEMSSLFAIVPVVYIVSYKYHIKDWLFSKLHTRVVTDETIFKHLEELIIVTDANLNIVSINDAVEKTLMQSRSELLNKPVFSALLLKDRDGKLVTKETFLPIEKASINDTFTLFRTAMPQINVTVQMQPVQDEEKHVNQISIIISFVQNNITSSNSKNSIEEKARVKYEALVSNLQKRLSENNDSELWLRAKLLEKIEADIYSLHLLQDYTDKMGTVRMDLAKLCKRVTLLEENFAKAFDTRIFFSLRNFSSEDIAPFLAGNFKATPEEFTGPFFTVSCDVKKMELLVKKLLDLSVFLSSKESQINVSLERKGKESIILEVDTSYPQIGEEDIPLLSIPYYGSMYRNTNLHFGSGLEGYLIKKCSDMMDLRLETFYKKEQSHLLFTITINKNFVSNFQK